MLIRFEKWEGTGNDFVLVDDRAGEFPAGDERLIRRLCDRHFGVGSDGLILIQAPHESGTDFHMEFFNPDGSKSFCGNGSRCAFAFWHMQPNAADRVRFTAVDGIHEGEMRGEEVAIRLPRVGQVDHAREEANVDYIHTGSPHELVWVPTVDAVDVATEGSRRRHGTRYGKAGTNVNFVHVNEGVLHMRTFERGVEAETLSCGSGVAAAALSAIYRGALISPVHVSAPGGQLRVEAKQVDREGFEGIWLIGPARRIFQGSIDL